MDNLLTLTMEAHNDAQNHHRRYEIVVGRDLLDDWTVAVRYGRIGQGGQEKRYASRKADDIQAIVRNRLSRRLTAPKRIGCAYRLVGFQSAPGFNAEPWLPRDVMVRLLMTA